LPLLFIGAMRCLRSIARRREFRFPDVSSPSLREGRKRGFASFRGGGAAREGESRNLRGEAQRKREEKSESDVRSVGNRAVSRTP
jgi:hypothetical protein